MISPDLLNILVCPQSRVSLRMGTPLEVEKIKIAMSQQLLKSQSGQFLVEPFDGLLVTEDSRVAYFIKDDIPILLAEKGIDLSILN